LDIGARPEVLDAAKMQYMYSFIIVALGLKMLENQRQKEEIPSAFCQTHTCSCKLYVQIIGLFLDWEVVCDIHPAAAPSSTNH
jgi:hypothetical protein